MSLEHFDNFSVYGTGDISRNYMLDGVFAQINTGVSGQNLVTASPDGNGLALLIFRAGNSNGLVRYVCQTPSDVFGMACRFYLPSIPADTSQQPIFSSVQNASNTTIAYCYIGTVGNIIVKDGSNNLLGDTVGPVISANAFYHIEVKYDITSGTIGVRVEGVTVLDLSGLSLGANDVAQCQYFQGNSSSPVMYIKDVIYWNGEGTRNNDFLGSCVIYPLVEESDVNTNWASSTGTTLCDLINESGPPDDTDYIVADDALPPAYVATLSDLPADVTSVKGIMSIVRAKKTDGGDGNLQMGFVSAMNTDLGSDRPITAAFTYWRDFSEEDPDTNQPWLPSAVNDMNLQFDRTI